MSKFDDLANRVKKTARHLGKWAAREGVTCWRVYDRDIPELPVTIDTYDGALVINDYRHTDAAGERGGGDAWLDEVSAAARSALGATEVFVKQRARLTHRDGDQYQRDERGGHLPSQRASTSAAPFGAAARPGGAGACASAQQRAPAEPELARRVVREGGHAFLVDLAGYVDTGLFLDHRITRAKVAAEPGATLLNLFAYTGSFSVYAAAAGKRTTTVDLSHTYLAWAGDNLARNRLAGELIHADIRAFLGDARRAGRAWDVIICDPPTFSNSKRMDYVWDVQRDHGALLDDVLAVWTGAGAVWFSTNKHKFALDWRPRHGHLTDQTRATTPPDFRTTPHYAFRVAARP